MVAFDGLRRARLPPVGGMPFEFDGMRFDNARDFKVVEFNGLRWARRLLRSRGMLVEFDGVVDGVDGMFVEFDFAIQAALSLFKPRDSCTILPPRGAW